MGAYLDRVLSLAAPDATEPVLLDTPEPDEWDESDWDDVREHLINEDPWFDRVLAGEAPGEPDEEPEIQMTPRTAEASTVPQPTGKPGGSGLFHVKGLQLPPYVQHLYKHLVARYGKHRAYGVAIGIVKKWAAGVNPGGKGKGHKVHADVQAAAGKNVAQWEKDKAKAHESKTTHVSDLDRVLALAGGAPAAWPSGRPYEESFLPKPGGGPGSGKTKLKQGYPTNAGVITTAPGAQPIVYGHLRQAPSQTVAAGPPLPPGVSLPDPKEFEALAGKISDGPDRELAESARSHLKIAARKFRTGDRQGPLTLLRIVQTDLHALYRKVVAENRPHEAQVFSEKGFAGSVPPAAQSSARAEMYANRDQMLEYRAQVVQVAKWIDLFRRTYFHGQYQGVAEGRFSAPADLIAEGLVALAEVGGYERHTPMGRIVSVRNYERVRGEPPYSGKLIGSEADQAIREGKAIGEFGEPTGYFQTSDGRKMWGWYGAAGLLVRHTDESGVQRYLLQKRAPWVDQGNTYSIPGGAMEHRNGIPETPEEAGRREAEEEFGGTGLPEGTKVAEVRTKTMGEGPGAWSYHTVVMDSPARFMPEGDHETGGHVWVTPREMADLPLHPHFRATAEELGMSPGGGMRHPEPGGNTMGLANSQIASALLALTEVDPYKRISKGKLELVRSYERKQGRFVDVLGHRHWGWYGGAGILPYHTDEHGTVRYGLQKRAGGVQHSGSYSTAGGAIDKLDTGEIETPVAAALREAEEEFGHTPEGEVTKVYTDQHGTAGEPGSWAYHTVHVNYPEMFQQSEKASHGFESGGITWVTAEEAGRLPLHPDFRAYAEAHLGVQADPSKQPSDYTVKQEMPDQDFRKGDVVHFQTKKYGIVQGVVKLEPDFKHDTYLVQPMVEGVKPGEVKREHITTEPPGHPPKPVKIGPVNMPEPRAPGEFREGDEVKWTDEGGKERKGRVTYVHSEGSVDVARPWKQSPKPQGAPGGHGLGTAPVFPGGTLLHEKKAPSLSPVTGGGAKTSKFAEGDSVKRRSFHGNDWDVGKIMRASVATSALGYPVHQVQFGHGAANVPESMLKHA